MRPYWFFLTGFLLLGACGDAGKTDEEDIVESGSAEELYEAGLIELENGDYTDAAEQFELVEQDYPYSPLAKKAQVMAAYSYYRNLKYEEALGILGRYVKLYPGDEETAYAYYLMALSQYEQIVDVGRDQKATVQAQDALNEVIRRYPESEYARDAQLKLDLVADHLAGKEMEVGRYYLKQQEYLAAINRFKTVIDKHQTTAHVPEALHRLVESYLRLGITAEAQKYAAVLGYNYPNSEWYRASYALLEGETGEAPDPSQGKWLGIF